jgi:hypothetical protein
MNVGCAKSLDYSTHMFAEGLSNCRGVYYYDLHDVSWSSSVGKLFHILYHRPALELSRWDHCVYMTLDRQCNTEYSLSEYPLRPWCYETDDDYDMRRKRRIYGFLNR